MKLNRGEVRENSRKPEKETGAAGGPQGQELLSRINTGGLVCLSASSTQKSEQMENPTLLNPGERVQSRYVCGMAHSNSVRSEWPGWQYTTLEWSGREGDTHGCWRGDGWMPDR